MKFKNLIKKIFLSLVLLQLFSCHENDKKILGTWQMTGIEDGCQYVETYTFYGEDNDNRFEHSYVPQDYSHIGFKASGRWNTDIIGNLELYYDLRTVEPVYNYYVNDPLEDFNIRMYISSLKDKINLQNKEMEESSIGLDFKGNQMILETLSGKEYYNKVNGGRYPASSKRGKNNYVYDKGDNDETGEEILYADEVDSLGIDGYVDIAEEGSLGDLDDFDWLSERYVTPDDLNWRSKDSLRILRNWIFARHGYKFKSQDLIQYFSQYPWYTPRFDNVNSQLSEIELYNIDLIKEYEKRQ